MPLWLKTMIWTPIHGMWGLRELLDLRTLFARSGLLGMLDPIYLSDQKDSVKWAFERNGECSTKSMYRWLTFDRVSEF